MKRNPASEKKEEIIAEEKNDHIDITATYINQFKIQGKVATYIGQDWTKTQLLGSIRVTEKGTFSIKIRKTKRRYLWLGVVDATYRTNRWSWGLPNWVYYCGWNGKVYEGPDQNIKLEGTGYKEG